MHSARPFFSVVGALSVTLFAAATLVSCGSEPRLDLLGSPAPASAANQVITIQPDTRYVYVTGGDTVTFISGAKSFTWYFGNSPTVWGFRLNRVAPPGMLDHQVMVEIAPDPRYIGGGEGKD